MTPEQVERTRAYQAEYRARNAAALQAYRAEKSAVRNAATKKWLEDNREMVRASARARYAKDPSKKRASAAKYRAENPDLVRASMKAWAANNKSVVSQHNRNAKALRKRAEGSHTAADISDLYVKQRGKCTACRVRLGDVFHVDHIVALARGGRNDKPNLQLLCPDCNLRKGAKHPIDFMQEKGFLL